MPRFTVITEARATFEQGVEAESPEEAISLTENMRLGTPIEVTDSEVTDVIKEEG